MKQSNFDFGLVTHWLRELAGVVLVVAIVLATRGYVRADDTPSGKTPTAWLRITDPPGLNPAGRNVQQFETYRRTQAQQIRSSIVLQAALEKDIKDLPALKSERDPQQWLEDHLKVVTPPESELIQISLSGTDPAQTVKIVNAVKDAYLEKVVAKEREDLLKQSYLIESALKAKTNDVSRMQSALVELTRRGGNSTVDRELLRERYSGVYRLITNVRERRLEIDLQIAATQARVANSAADSAEAKQAKIDLAVANAQKDVLQRTQDELAKEIQGLTSDVNNASAESADLKDLQAKIREADASRAQLVQQLDGINLRLQMGSRVQDFSPATAP
jgi:hypothetical protein